MSVNIEQKPLIPAGSEAKDATTAPVDKTPQPAVAKKSAAVAKPPEVEQEEEEPQTTEAIQHEIRECQRSTGLLMSREDFGRVVQELIQDYNAAERLRFQDNGQPMPIRRKATAKAESDAEESKTDGTSTVADKEKETATGASEVDSASDKDDGEYVPNEEEEEEEDDEEEGTDTADDGSEADDPELGGPLFIESMDDTALDLMQRATEELLALMFQEANLLAAHRGSDEVTAADVKLVYDIKRLRGGKY